MATVIQFETQETDARLVAMADIVIDHHGIIAKGPGSGGEAPLGMAERAIEVRVPHTPAFLKAAQGAMDEREAEGAMCALVSLRDVSEETNETEVDLIRQAAVAVANGDLRVTCIEVTRR